MMYASFTEVKWLIAQQSQATMKDMHHAVETLRIGLEWETSPTDTELSMYALS